MKKRAAKGLNGLLASSPVALYQFVPKEMRVSRVVSVRLRNENYEKLAAVARIRKIEVSELVREVLLRWLASQKPLR